MYAHPHNLLMPFLKVPLSCNYLTSVTVFGLLLCYNVTTHTLVFHPLSSLTHLCHTTTVITHTLVSQPLSALAYLRHNHCHHSHTCVTTTVITHTPVSQPLSSLTHLCHNHCHHSHTCVTTTVLFQLWNQLNCIMPVFCHKGVTAKGNSHQTSSMPCGSTGEAVSRHTYIFVHMYTGTMKKTKYTIWRNGQGLDGELTEG